VLLVGQKVRKKHFFASLSAKGESNQEANSLLGQMKKRRWQ